ncbi:T9SS type A sorting domain-containing protein [Chryseobacterium indologenes]|uniref:T9SS type A sorting domain-containing protein n=1 Tax=Chryseobacterium indologenes TaxID=253 RepID=UPI002D7EE287|nr:T9SS type A sorting domain-containing protein [Chryseobacterium indologenes]MEB4761346.1 T9SS type A sorting domain-containing protein [Chryseobacterium indologenes]
MKSNVLKKSILTMKKVLLSAAILVVNFAFSQINILENFDNSTNLPTGFSGDCSINNTSNFSCSGNNSLSISVIPFVPKTMIYQSANSVTTGNDVKFKFNYKKSMSDGAGMTLTVSYKLLKSNGISYYEEDLSPINLSSSDNVNCTEYSATIPKSKITNNNSSIKFTFKLAVSNNATSFNSIFIDNFNVTQQLSLSTQEIQLDNKLSAYPNPTNKTLNIMNPKNGANKVLVYDASGKLVINKSFSSNEDKIAIDVEALTKGVYIYKIGELSSNFIKN